MFLFAYSVLFPRLYTERMSQVCDKLEEVKAGKAGEYLNPLAELQENMRIRTQVSGWRFSGWPSERLCTVQCSAFTMLSIFSEILTKDMKDNIYQC